MRYFLDCEFIEDGRTIDLISLALVAEDGREFYREVFDEEVPWYRASTWVLENVRPHLSGDADVVRTRLDLAWELLHFIGQDKPEFWADYAGYDWVVLCQLFGTMMDLPAGWPMFCMDLRQFAMGLGDPRLPAQTTTQHNALEDARWNRDTFDWLIRYSVQAFPAIREVYESLPDITRRS